MYVCMSCIIWYSSICISLLNVSFIVLGHFSLVLNEMSQSFVSCYSCIVYVVEFILLFIVKSYTQLLLMNL